MATGQDALFIVNFYAAALSGALLPVRCWAWVEADIGHVDGYGEQSIPVTVSTTPALTQDQAVAVGQQWILNNISTDPTQGQLMPQDNYSEPVIVLKVSVDDANSQELIYQIAYQAAMLSVDAQTGAVVSEDDWIGMTAGRSTSGNHAADRSLSATEMARRALSREDLWHVGLGSQPSSGGLSRLPVHTKDL